MRVPLLCLLTAAIVAPAGLGQQFTYDNTALPAQNIWTDGIEIADVDNDGDVDIVFANGNGYGSGGALQQHLYLNDGTGSFSNASSDLNVANFNAKMVIAEDFDNDGDLDLLYSPEGAANPPTQQPRYLINQGGDQLGTTGVFADESGTRLPARLMASFCVCAGDIDNDGDLDVVFTDGATFGGIARQVILYENDGAGNFTDVTATRMPVDTYNAQDVTLFDYDGDFDIDIAVSGKGAGGKRSRLYLNDGAGYFSVSTILDAIGTGNTYEIDWGDLDGDTDMDAAIQSISSGFNPPEGWGENIGTGSAPVTTTFNGTNGDDDNEMGMLDYDGDGDLDVFVGSLGSTEKAFRNDGGTFTRVNIIQAQGDSTLDIAFGDLDGDGDYDMVSGQGESGSFVNKVYVNGGAADTTAPSFLAVETPGAISVPDTVFRVRVQDAIFDDGHTNVRVTYSYTTTGGGGSAGGGTADPMGGGMYRAAVPTTVDTDSIALTWTATDTAGNFADGTGNSANFGPVEVEGQVWVDGGCELAGVSGNPLLLGTGTLRPGEPGTLVLSNARASATVGLFVSFTSTPTPFKGGTLKPVPFLDPTILVTSPGGAIPIGWSEWPAGLPSAFNLYFQYVIVDPAGVAGYAMSNALEVTTP